MPLPLGLVYTLSAVDDPGEHKQQVRKAVDVGEQLRHDSVGPERHHAPLEAATDGAGQMQRGSCRRATRHDETPEWRELSIQTIDPSLETLYVGSAELDLGHALRNTPAGIGEASTEGEEIPLQLCEDLGEAGVNAGRQHHPEMRIELVDFAARIDTRVCLGDAGTVEEAGFAGVAGPRVQRHDSIIVLELGGSWFWLEPGIGGRELGGWRRGVGERRSGHAWGVRPWWS